MVDPLTGTSGVAVSEVISGVCAPHRFTSMVTEAGGDSCSPLFTTSSTTNSPAMSAVKEGLTNVVELRAA